MESTSPYRTPASDIQPPSEGGNDLTPPYSPAGRFGRLSYIAWLMVMSIANWLIVAVLALVGLIELPVGTSGPPEIGSAATALWVAINLIVLVIAIIFANRRCHDIDLSGWWNLLLIIPIVNLIFGLFLLLKPGTDGSNRFGPARITPGWEKVVGIIGIVLMGIALVGILAAIAIPLIMNSSA